MVLLVIPPSPFLLDEKVFPALGILRIAAVLEKAGIDCDVLDLSGSSDPVAALCNRILGQWPHTIGITATTPQMPAVADIIAAIRTVMRPTRIIGGGPHITLCHAGHRKNPTSRAKRAIDQLASLFDVQILGDGEKAIFEALKPDAPAIINADDRKSPWFLTDDDYDAMPFPARHKIDLASYRYEIDGKPASSIIAQMGCPFSCSFCGGRNSPSLRFTRNRSVQSILDEIKHMISLGYQGINFFDDELNVSKSLVPLMNGIADLGADLRLRGFIKSELFTDEQASAMYRAGFRWILCGFESASPTILENINKRATLRDNERVMQIAHRHGLKVKALMSIGHPGESSVTVSTIGNWLVDMNVDDFDVTIITTYPGTPYHDEAVETAPGVWTYTAKYGDRLHAYDIDHLTDQAFYKGVPGHYKSFVHTDYLSAKALVWWRDETETYVRRNLNLAYPTARAAINYEHSMGMGPA